MYAFWPQNVFSLVELKLFDLDFGVVEVEVEARRRLLDVEGDGARSRIIRRRACQALDKIQIDRC